MRLELVRRWFTEASTIGELSVDGKHQCYILEDRFRLPWEGKVPARTCIPCGTYRVVITPSPRFGVEMPLLLDVRGFSGVRIHPGNTPSDTEGCLLPGLERHEDRVLASREAYIALYATLAAALAREEPVTITITALFT